MRNVAREHGKARLEPPMTPMIDIVFQLLIFFLLTPSFPAAEGYLTTNLPTTQGPNRARQRDIPRIKISLYDEEPRGEGVSIEVNETKALGSTVGQRFINEDHKRRYVRSLFDTLKAELDALANQGLPPDHPVLIAPTPAVQHAYVVRAFDAAVAARFNNIQFAVPRYMVPSAAGGEGGGG